MQDLKRELRGSFAHHPEPPQTEAVAGLFAFRGRMAVAEVLAELKKAEEDVRAEIRDRLDVVCVLGKGLVLGGSFLHVLTSGEPPQAASVPSRQQRVAFATENSLFLFYSGLLDYILARGDVKPQLMSYMAPDTPLGEVVAVD